MDVQAQNSVSEKLNAPPGWTKKLVPAKAKNITLRKYDVIFIAPDGQEVKSKWHLHRYLKAHPEGPAFSEFVWSSGEETPIRRSARFATREPFEINKNVSKKKGKRNASEMEAQETEEDPVKTPARKRAKEAGKPEGLVDKNVGESEVDFPRKDEVMHEAQDEAVPCESEATQDQSLVEVEENKEAVTEVEENKEAVTEKASNEELKKQVEAEITMVSNATNGGKHEELKVVEVKEHVEAGIIESTTVHVQAEVELKGAPEISLLVAPSDELKNGEIAIMDSEKPIEHADDNIVELKEPLDWVFEGKEDVSYKVTMQTSVAQEPEEGSGKLLEPLIRREEQEKLLNIENSPPTKDKGPSEFSSSSVPFSIANQ